ncbi:hypothetical protein GGH19_002619 [Coemansia sp. RSA 1807]|nr:hypothetical protein GGH19_002619 [Coemansia sp. RSA 1807]
MFGSGGGFGSSSSGTGFGGFGQSSQNKPASSFGGFGQTSNTSTGFGQTTGGFGSTTSAFGSTAGTAGTGATTSAFGGTGSGGFGSTGNTGFGSSSQTNTTSTLFGGGSGGGFGSSVTATGTERVPYAPVEDSSPAGKREVYNNICFMEAYKNFSPEELRLQDYEAGRNAKQPEPSAGGFGQTSGTGFGQTSGTGFGQTTGSAFGQKAGTTGFGQTSGTGFGAAATANKPSGFGAFSGGSGIGGFGQTSAAAATPAFGQAATTGFGATANTGFGAAANTGFGGFGSSGTAGATGTTGGFGAGAGTTGQSAFGQTSGATGGFGSTTGFGAKPAFGGSTGAFGATATSQPAASTGFGQTATTGFGQSAGTGFGQSAGTGFGQTATTGGGMFGSTSAAPASTGLFGSGAASTGGGMFGAKPAASTGGGLFGSTTAGTGATGGGLFGSSTTNTSTLGTGGMFGSTAANPAATGGGLFGGTSGGSLFGAKPAASTSGGLFGSAGTGTAAAPASTGGGLFGSSGTGAAAGTGGLFGSTNTGTAAAPGAGTAGGGLFGNTSTNTGGGLFGAQPAANTAPSGGLFGSSGAGTSGGFGFGFGGQGATQPAAQQQTPQNQLFQTQQAQPTLQTGQLSAQIDRQPYGVSALFDTSKLANRAATKLGSSHLTATPLRASMLSQTGAEKDHESKKRGLNLQRLASPHVSSAVSSRLRARGFAVPTATLTRKAAGPLSTSSAAAPRTPASRGREVSGLFGRDGFLSPDNQLPHSNVKRLVITRKPSFGSVHGASPGSVKRTQNAVDSTPVRERATTCTELLTASTSPPPMDNPWASSTPAKRRSVTAVVAEEDDDAFEVPVVNQDERDVEDETGGYWMRPPLEDLRAMSTQQLRTVRNFTVGCDGVGQVSFNRPVDLTSVGSLGTIAGGVVLFDDRVCTVYPDESNKPARGQGLNVPATISLHMCWPVDRATGEPIEQMDDPRVRKHIRRLRKIEETEFVDFVDGTWIFRVEHFSRYGLDDNQEDGFDEEDVEEDLDIDLDQPQGFDQATAAPADRAQGRMDDSRAVADAHSMSDSGSEATDVLAESESDSPENEQERTPYVPPPRQLLLGGRHAASLRRAPVMRASLFSTTSTSSAQSAPAAENVGTKRRSTALEAAKPVVPAVHRLRASRRQKRQRGAPSSRASTAASTVAVSVAALDLPHPSKYLRASESRIARSLMASPQPYERSLTHGRSGMSADAGLMMARSFRVAFGPQGQLVYLQGEASSVLTIDNLAHHLHANHDDAVALHTSTVRAQWEHSVISTGDDESPQVSFRETTSIASVLAVLQQTDSAVSSEEQRLLELAAVLFDESADNTNEHVRMIRQRQGVTQWLMGAVYDAVQRDLLHAGKSQSPAAAAVFALLSGHRIEAACLAATAHRDYRLATLVAQSGSGGVGGGGNDKQMQALLRAQLKGPAFAPEYQRVYEVLAGDGVAAGLDWKRAFGLGLWFTQTPVDSVSSAVQSFQRDFERGVQVAPPLPSWLFKPGTEDLAAQSADELREDRRGESAVDLLQRGVYDAVFQLLRLFAQPAYPLERALPSEAFTPARGDVRQSAMLAWLLARVRRCRGFDDMMSYDWLLASWAAQLEVLGLWHWACYVLLQLSSPPHRNHAIRALLERALPNSLPTVSLPPAIGADLLPGISSDSTDAVEEQIRFVLQELQLPRSWLFAAYATRSRYDRDWAETHVVRSRVPSAPLTTSSHFGRLASAQHVAPVLDTVAETILQHFVWLLSANQAAAAHALVLQRIAPDAVLRGEYHVLKRVLEHLQSVQHLVPRDEWMAGGQVYLTFIASIDELPNVLSSIASGAGDAEALAQRANTIYEQMSVLLTALPALLARFNTQAHVVGIYDSHEANWYVGSEASELHVKYSVAVSEMASMVTGFVQELGSGDMKSVDASSVPLAQDMRILRTYQLAKSCFGSLVSSELEA